MALPGPRRVWRALTAHHLDQEPRHVATFVAFGVGLSLAAAVGVAWTAGFRNVASAFWHVNPFWFPIALGGAAAANIGYLLAYREIAHVNEGPRVGRLRALALVATGFGIFVPRGGFALDLEALRDLGFPAREARIRVLGLGALEYAVLATGTSVCSLFLLAEHAPHVHSAVTLSWGIGVPIGTALALFAVTHRDLICRGKVGELLRPSLDGLHVVGCIVAAPRRHGVAAVFGMAIYWASEVFVLYTCLAAFSHRAPSVTAVVVGYATGYALTRRTLPFAGAGAVEALLPFALGWVGYRLAPALLAVLAYRVFNVWLPVGPALGGLVALRRRRRPRREVSDVRRSPS
ncbi:MAG TPA: lysylphosphatidylglycerol synthase domain-containing protein [Gaiellaceae bacterium]|nr:lysylphosphatidylglycerol synthase domain-containing protein [Gaiellaceae bacterium]